MKVVYLIQYFFPEVASGQSLVLDLIEGMIDNGWEVELFTPTPTRGVSQEIRKQYKSKGKKQEVFMNGRMIVHRIPLFRESKSLFSRALRYLIFSLECLFVCLFTNADLIFTGSGPPTQGLAVGLVHKIRNKVVVYNLQDIFPDSLINAGICSSNSIVVSVGKIVENITYNNVNKIITISNTMLQNVLNKGVSKDKVVVINNWIDTDAIRPICRDRNLIFDELKLDRNNFYIIYAGNLGNTQGIEYILEAAKYLINYKDLKILLFGNGSEERKLKNIAFEMQLNNVVFFPLQPIDRVAEVYGIGDASIISYKPGAGKAGMPSKTWSIMASGTAIIGFVDLEGELSKIIKDANCGLCAEAGNPKELVKAILKLYFNRYLCSEYSFNARKYAELYISKKVAVSNYISTIKEAMK